MSILDKTNKFSKLVLFDVDGTLLQGIEAHVFALCQALEKVYKIKTTFDPQDYYGTTDLFVIDDILKKKGLNKEVIESKIKKFIEIAGKYFDEIVNNYQIVALEGVEEILERLSKENILLGLLTGNLESIARGKLRKLGLNHYFKLGGFGSDDINRKNLVRIAIKRAEKDFDFSVKNNVFIVGNTPKEMEVKISSEIKIIGVVTDIYSKEELKKAGADYVLENFRNINEFLEIIF